MISVNSLLVHSFDGLVHLDPNTAYAASYKIFCTTCIVTNREAFTSTTTGSWASSTQHTVSWNEHNTAVLTFPYVHMHICTYHHHNTESRQNVHQQLVCVIIIQDIHIYIHSFFSFFFHISN